MTAMTKLHMTAMMMNDIIKGHQYRITGSSILNIRFAKDIDIICYQKDILVETTGDEYIRSTIINGKKFEFLLADNQESLQQILSTENYFNDEEIYLILKRGHLHIAGRRQDNWEKHMLDYNILKKIVDKSNYDVNRLIELHKKSTNERIKQRTPRLNGVSKSDFFDDNVEKFIDHDVIHEEVAYDSKPAYSKMQKDDTVQCHKDLWLQMEFQERFQCVAEEAMVIAIERHLLPSEINNTLGKPAFIAYKWALWRICTTLCSGWFREFAIENYYHVLNMFDQNKIEQSLNNIIKKIKENEPNN